MAGMLPPQVQLLMAAPTANVLGVRVMVFVSIAASLKPCAVTVITPADDVSIFATYFEVEVDDSQPQELSTVGSEEDVCTASVMEVRQLEAAKITSDIFAFFV